MKGGFHWLELCVWLQLCFLQNLLKFKSKKVFHCSGVQHEFFSLNCNHIQPFSGAIVLFCRNVLLPAASAVAFASKLVCHYYKPLMVTLMAAHDKTWVTFSFCFVSLILYSESDRMSNSKISIQILSHGRNVLGNNPASRRGVGVGSISVKIVLS